MNEPMVMCPAGICAKQTGAIDHDRMFGHLLVGHSWTFDTAQDWVVENMPDDTEPNKSGVGSV